MSEGLAWPPRKEDLLRLYAGQKLSAAKIAGAYGLKSANPKSSETLILYHLRKVGIVRRDRAEHIRRVTEEMVNDWVRRYQAGESLKQIAGSSFDPVTVYYHLKRIGVQLRDKVEAQIKAVKKYERRPFGGDGIERAYLMGLRYGDLHAVRHGRAVRVRVSTTHPAMAALFESLFSPYGHVSRYPRTAKLTGYEWSLECDLDCSFQFLLSKLTVTELDRLSENEALAFLAGLFDAEGSVYLHNKRGRHNPEAFFSNTDNGLLDYVSARLRIVGLDPTVQWINQKTDRNGVTGESKIGRVILWRFLEVQELLRVLQLRHPEKIAKSKLVVGLGYHSSESEHAEFLRNWGSLLAQIKKDRDAFIDLARRDTESK